jgi:hypothetical protein
MGQTRKCLSRPANDECPLPRKRKLSSIFAAIRRASCLVNRVNSVNLILARYLMTLFRFARENAACDYKCGHGRKKHPKLNLLHRGVSIAPTPLG